MVCVEPEPSTGTALNRISPMEALRARQLCRGGSDVPELECTVAETICPLPWIELRRWRWGWLCLGLEGCTSQAASKV